MKLNQFLSLFAFVGVALSAKAAPIVTYTMTHTATDYVFDFTIVNNLGGTNNIYAFGVGTGTLSGQPMGWLPEPGLDLGPIGGPNHVYPYFLEPSLGRNQYAFLPGETLSGFKVNYSSLPTSIDYFVAAFGGIYTGNDYINTSDNPVFLGTFQVAPPTVPEPIAALPFALMALKRRRKV